MAGALSDRIGLDSAMTLVSSLVSSLFFFNSQTGMFESFSTVLSFSSDLLSSTELLKLFCLIALAFIFLFYISGSSWSKPSDSSWNSLISTSEQLSLISSESSPTGRSSTDWSSCNFLSRSFTNRLSSNFRLSTYLEMHLDFIWMIKRQMHK